MIRPACLVLAAWIVLAQTAAGGDSPIPAFPAVPGAKAPRPGEWLEYVVSFPLDPLEQSIRASIIPGSDDNERTQTHETRPTPRTATPNPSFDPPIEWGSYPLRLEILSTTREGCNAIMTFNDLRHEVFLPLAPPRDNASAMAANQAAIRTPQVTGDAPIDNASLKDIFEDAAQQSAFADPENEPIRAKGQHWLGDLAIEVESECVLAPNTGYTRLTSPEVPFGLARFASDFLDLALVAKGMGNPPDFPCPDTQIEPPPGTLHQKQPYN